MLYQNKITKYFKPVNETNLGRTKKSCHSTKFANCQCNGFCNTKPAIHKLDSDILYRIFTLVVNNFSFRTVLDISHVCHYWRTSVLGWPTLWAFMNLNDSPEYMDMFLQRSQNAPLELRWTTSDNPGFELEPHFDQYPSRLYLMLYEDSILPRLRTLNMYTSYINFSQFLRTVQVVGSSLSQLRRVDVYLFNGNQIYPVPPLSTDTLYNEHLQEIVFEGLDLPCFQLSHNSLTRLKFNNRINALALSQLLVFLSNCPSLKFLDVEFQDDHDRETAAAFIMPTNKLTLDLIGLEIGAYGSISFDFLERFSGCIRIPRMLDTFWLHYTLDPTSESDSEVNDLELPSRALPLGQWPIPPEVFSQFSSFQYLNVRFTKLNGWLRLCGHTSASDHAKEIRSLSCPFIVECCDLETLCYFPVLALINTMPQLQHLVLEDLAWFIFPLRAEYHDTPSAFPRLHILQVKEFSIDGLNSLPADLKAERLILESCVVSEKALVEATLRMGVRVLELNKVRGFGGNGYLNGVRTLQELGVNVVWKL